MNFKNSELCGFDLRFLNDGKAKNIFIAVFISLWSCLYTTILKSVIRHNLGHSIIHAVQTVFFYLIFYASKNVTVAMLQFFFALFSHYQIGYLLKRQMVVRGCLFCHRFAENLVTTHFPICPFYVAYISYVVCQGPGLSKNQRLYKSTICILLFQSICYCCTSEIYIQSAPNNSNET